MDLTLMLITVYLTGRANCEVSGTTNSLPLRQSFSEVVKSRYYIDKTILIKDILETDYGSIFLHAPSGFGKSINLQMLKHFMQIQVDENGKEIMNKTTTTNFELFKNTKICKEYGEFFKKYFGKFPVIYVEYSELRHFTSYDEVFGKLKNVLCRTFSEHKYLMNENYVWEKAETRPYFHKFMDKSNSLTEQDMKFSLEYLGNLLLEYFNRIPVILIDDYGFYTDDLLFGNLKDMDKVLNLFESMHYPLLRRENLIFCGTGVFHLSTSGMPLDGSNRYVRNWLFLQRHPYVEYYGLLEHELTHMLSAFTNNKNQMNHIRNDIHKYYGGYNEMFNGGSVYNVRSVLEFLQRKQNRIVDAFKPQQVETMFYKSFVHMFYSENVKWELVKLLTYEKVELITYSLTFSENSVKMFQKIMSDPHQLHTLNYSDLVLYFLLITGYLTYSDLSFNKHSRVAVIKVSTMETRAQIESMLLETVIQQFNFSLDQVNEILANFNEISETNAEQTKFEHLFFNYNKLMSLSSYKETSYKYLLTIVTLIFGHRFRLILTRGLDPQYSHFIYQFRNKNDVLFNIAGEIVTAKEEFAESTMRKCTSKAVDKIIERKWCTEFDRVVNVGLCFGFKLCENGVAINRTFGLGYSKELSDNDDIERKVIYV